MRLLLASLLVLPALAADAGYNGRWDIFVPNEGRSRAWWLEVAGASGPGPLKGRFVGFPGGDMNPIDDLAIKNGELTFSSSRGNQNLKYRARLAGGELVGTRVSANGETLYWTGQRAPVITEKDDGSWKAGKPVALFNGKDLGGWKPMVPGKPPGWSVRDGLMANSAAANNLVSEQKFWNFILRAEYRYGKSSNSGIGLRGRYEVQIQDDYGKPLDSHMHGAIYSRIQPTVNACKPAGEWQRLEVRLVGLQVTVVLNGQKIIDKQEIEGLTAMAHDPKEGEPGPISVQGDHREVEFRSIVVTPLEKKR